MIKGKLRVWEKITGEWDFFMYGWEIIAKFDLELNIGRVLDKDDKKWGVIT